MSYKKFNLFGSGLSGAWIVRIARQEPSGDEYLDVIELAALEACQKRLDEAISIIKGLSDFQDSIEASRVAYDKAYEFLKGVEG